MYYTVAYERQLNESSMRMQNTNTNQFLARHTGNKQWPPLSLSFPPSLFLLWLLLEREKSPPDTSSSFSSPKRLLLLLIVGVSFRRVPQELNSPFSRLQFFFLLLFGLSSCSKRKQHSYYHHHVGSILSCREYCHQEQQQQQDQKVEHCGENHPR